MIPEARSWSLADTKAMLAEAGITIEVLSAVELAEAGVYSDSIVSMPTGNAVADAVYNMERASRDCTLPIRHTIGGAQ